MNEFRTHRFPPLSHFGRPGPTSGATGNPLQSSLSDGFQHGMNEGFAEGRAAGHAAGSEKGLREGREAGLVQGREDGRRETLVSLETLGRPVDAMLEALRRLQTDYQQAQRKEVVDLVAKVARQVIRAELALQPAQLLTLVDETLAVMPATAETIEVYLNPEELTRICEIDPERAQRWTLIPDAKLVSGECRVKSGDHEADAGCQQRLAACMEQVSHRLMQAVESGQAPNADPAAGAMARKPAP